jgi:hypothetical protein
MMLAILFSGPKQPSDRIDVYLRPLVDDLKILWKPSVPEVWDEYKREEFTIRFSENPAHHNLSGQSKRNGSACPHCLEDTCAIWLRHSKKYLFMGHCRFLRKKHPYRPMDCQFNGEKDNRETSLHLTRDLVHLKVKDIKTIEELPKLTEKTLGKRKKRDGEEEKGMWNKKSILWELEYWQMLNVRHSIGNMHIKKNVCEATCGTLLQQKSNGKDHKNTRDDLKELGIREELYAEETETGTNLPVTATTLSKAERKEFCQFLHYLKVPSGYSSNFKRLGSVKDMKMNFNLMKSYDCHVLMTTLHPVAFRGIKTELVRNTVISLCLFFNVIEQKVIDDEKLLDLERRNFETLCLLEATFPPSFFDLMLHLTAHLAREIWFLGPSYLHQMFPYERLYGFLKSLVYNRLFPKGAIIRGYETIEAVEWAMGYMDPQNPISVPRSQHEGRLSGVGTMGKRSVTPDADVPKGSFHRDTTTASNYTICQ